MVGSKTSLLLWTRGICRGWPGEEEEGGPGYTWPGVWNLTLQDTVRHHEREAQITHTQRRIGDRESCWPDWSQSMSQLEQERKVKTVPVYYTLLLGHWPADELILAVDTLT